jgi:hypothetical protein
VEELREGVKVWFASKIQPHLVGNIPQSIESLPLAL